MLAIFFLGSEPDSCCQLPYSWVGSPNRSQEAIVWGQLISLLPYF